MSYVEIYFPLEISRELTYLVGELNCLMVKDLNENVSKFQRSYINQIKKLTEVESHLQYMSEIVQLHFDQTIKYLPPPELLFDDDGNNFEDERLNSQGQLLDADSFSNSDTNEQEDSHPTTSVHRTFLQNFRVPNSEEIHNCCEDISQFSSRLRSLNDSYLEMIKKTKRLLEHRSVVYESSKFLKFNPGFIVSEASAGLPQNFNNPNDLDLEVESIRDLRNENFDISDDDFDIDSEHDFVNHDTQSAHSNAFMSENILSHYGSLKIGSIERTKIEPLRKLLWRTSRGNMFFHNIPIDPTINNKVHDLNSTSASFVQKSQFNPNTDNPEGEVEKDCFVVFSHGELLMERITKIIDSLNGTVYDLPDGATSSTLNMQIEQVQQILDATEQALLTELVVVQDQLLKWTRLVSKEKMVYSTMNLFKKEHHDGAGLILEGWIPTKRLDRFTNKLKDFTHLNYPDMVQPVVSLIDTNKTPPTFFETNKFTSAFQSIVDAYGVASYKEINPGLATIVTFPFMFSIMFGDLGHGIIVMLCGLYLIINETQFTKKQRSDKIKGQQNEIFDMVFGGRYVILLMGLFSMYIGLLYNDIFSKSMTLFGRSGWEWPKDFKIGETIEATKVQGKVYPFGLDFGWHGAENGLLFSNSYKMKLSILMGFIHMTYSYMFSYVNYKFKNSKVDIIGNFIPGLIFMQSIFGYLSICIVYKWGKDWIKDSKEAPGLLNMLINMFLSPGNIDVPLYPGQPFVQIVLLLAALVCVPWLLLYKPLKLRKENANAQNRGFNSTEHEFLENRLLESDELAGEEMRVTDYEHPEEFNFGDIMIHQVIHTIEFCLNCISHTASYLRLWALSLAHAQLSTVLWTMTIQNSFSSANPGSFLSVLKVVLLFGLWFVLTVCILVLMEGTSAMLHALRLHWVEAMSKFFEGEGYAYEPFSINEL